MAWCQGCSSVKIDPQLSHQDTPSLSLVIFCCGFQGHQRLHKDDVTIRIKWLHRSWAPCFFLEHDNKILFLWWPLQIRHGAWLVKWISFVSRPLPSWTGKPWSQLLYRCPLLRWLPGGMHPLNAVQVDFDISGLHWCCIASKKWIHFGSSKKSQSWIWFLASSQKVGPAHSAFGFAHITCSHHPVMIRMHHTWTCLYFPNTGKEVCSLIALLLTLNFLVH